MDAIRKLMMSQPKISIIIPACNCEKTIEQTIKAVLSQKDVKDVEVIIVDDGSSDRTAKIIQSFPSVKYIFQENAGPAAARNRGAKEARGEILFFTDGDCIPHDDWIEKMVPCFNDQKVAVVAGSYGIANPDNLLARCIHAEIRFRHSRLMPKYPKSFGSYNFGVRKKVFDNVGGFNTGYRYASGEDNDLSYKILKLTSLIYFNNESQVDHFHTVKLGKYLHEQFRHGFWRVKMYMDHPLMTRGDNYTFWKDIVEVPLALISLAGLLFVFLYSPVLLMVSQGSLGVLFLLEIVFGILFMKDFITGLFFSFVMFIRSFIRSFGFIFGLLIYPFQKKN